MATKDPAFLFYASDFLTGIQDLTMEERGQYITLLCIHHQKGRLSKKLIELSVGNATADVMHKFSVDEEGLFFNERLESEMLKRKQHSEKQKDRAIKGWEKRKVLLSHGNATALPLENENKDINNTIKGVDIFFKDLPNSVLFENITRDLNFTKEKLNSFVPKFRLACKTEYPNFPEFANHFKNWVRKESANEKPTIKRTGLV